MSRKKKNKKSPLTESDDLINNPFGALSFDNLPEMEKKPEPVKKVGAYPEIGRHLFKIRIEKKGRGGKSVTVIYDLPDHCDDVLMTMSSDLRRQLGTGGTFSNGTIERQGDLRRKAADWLIEKGIRVIGDIP